MKTFLRSYFTIARIRGSSDPRPAVLRYEDGQYTDIGRLSNEDSLVINPLINQTFTRSDLQLLAELLEYAMTIQMNTEFPEIGCEEVKF